MNDQSSSSTLTTTLDYALKYCECQFSVLPLAAKDKRPILNTWKPQQNERADGEQIRRWFSNTEYNIAISTGRISSIIAFDIDGDRAKKYFEES